MSRKARLFVTAFVELWNFVIQRRAYPSVYLIQLRDYGQDTIFVKGSWCINQESESCPSCSQHIVL